MTLALWWVDPQAVPATPESLTLLSTEELAQYHRFIPDAKRQEYLATRVMARSVLGAIENTAPRNLVFVRNEWGRPALEPGPRSTKVNFNLSHTDGLVVCLVSHDYEVGIDTEALARAPAVLRLAPRVFAPQELAAMALLPQDARAQRALRIWTLKESYIKARGRGMSLRLSGIAFTFANESVRLELAPDVSETGPPWRFDTRLLGKHLISLSLRPLTPENELAPEGAVPLQLIDFATKRFDNGN